MGTQPPWHSCDTILSVNCATFIWPCNSCSIAVACCLWRSTSSFRTLATKSASAPISTSISPCGQSRSPIFSQTVGLGLDHIEHFVAERPDELLGVSGADAADHSRTEVFLDPLDRGRSGGLQEPRAELLAVRPVIDPLARRGDPFACRDRRGLTDHCHEVAMSARLGSENTEPVLLVVEGDPLNQARQHFLRRRPQFRIHPGNDRLPPLMRRRVTTRFSETRRPLELTNQHCFSWSRIY